MLQAIGRPRSGEIVLVALGGNVNSPLGSVAATIQKSIELISDRLGVEVVQSRFFRTPAFPEGAGPDFVNAAIRLHTDLPAQEILITLHEIEAEAARHRDIRWGQRTLDLDLIAVGRQILPNAPTYDVWRNLSVDQQVKIAPDQLILPHPRVQDRSFVLVPLADVAPDWVHPVLGQTVLEMRDARPAAELRSVVALPAA